MKTKIGILVLALCTSYFSMQAQQRVNTTTRANSKDISDNLDLNAVSSIFADSKDLEDFEYRLNDPDSRISNLDLNQDGYVDYLRVVETTNDRNSLVVIQAVLDKDVYQDVATIEIERVPDGQNRVQVIGDSWIYGPNYIIQPVFVRPPLIFSFFWGPRYSVWTSPFYWGFYPRFFYSFRPYPIHRYNRHINIYVDRRITFNRVNERSFRINDEGFNHIRRNDFAKRYPDRSYENRRHESTNSGRQPQRQPSRSIDSQPGRRAESGNTNRTNENIKRGVQQNNANQPGRQINQGRQNPTQQREIKKSREYRQPIQTQQRNQSGVQQRTPQTRPESRERFRQQINNQPRERSGAVQQRRQPRTETRQSTQSTRKAEPAKKRESRERRRNE